ncbi:MAG: glycosyltransferase [Proteobacteria bacterium]|nr:glycosyltransferase [Pseudomonadota bacterium]
MENLRPVRVCILGAAAAPEWLPALASALPADARTADFGTLDACAALRAAAKQFPGENLILIRAGTALPPFWFERLAPALSLPEVLVASALDNVDPANAPLPAGIRSTADPARIDALCWAHGRHDAIDWPAFSPLLSLWNGAALRTIDPEALRTPAVPASAAPWRGVVLDDLYVADPTRDLSGPHSPAAGDDAPPPSALGELREAVAAALAHPASAAGYPGLDAKPVVLHVLHGWGGGAERFVRDIAAADRERHHLVLMARGNFERRRHGERLELRAATLSLPPLREAVLPDPIASTALAHRGYREFLDGVLRDFAVDAVVVSSLIGHSLDALRSGVPTLYFIHDFYPLWPLLHRNLDDTAVRFDAAQLRADLAGAEAGFEFAERDPDWWLVLRERLADAALAAQATLLAPSRSALDIFLKLQPRLASLPKNVIAHGIAPWPAAVKRPLPAPPARDKLRLVILGRVRGGKAANLLRKLLPHLRGIEWFLLGAGAEAREFFGRADVHILLNYTTAELPALIARIGPDAALMPADLPETFSYTLSELRSLGIPVLATRLGALGERIADGVDGFLVAPEAPAIAAAIESLRADPARLARVRATLAQQLPRTLADMAADYRRLLPLAPRPRHARRLAVAGTGRLAAQQRAELVGEAQREIESLEGKIAGQQRELEHRAQWAFGLDTQLKQAGEVLRKSRIELAEREAAAAERLRRLQGEFDERSAWALALDRDLQAANRERDALRSERDALRSERDALRGERERILHSLSWRITKPLRFARRTGRTLVARLGYLAGRLRALAHRTRGSLASRGVAGTLRRAADEFRRDAPPANARTVSAPTSAFRPFAVPASETPRVSIVIPVFNQIDYTIACLRSLAERPCVASCEVVVVDDASTDATAERLAQVSGIRIVRNARNLGFVGSCNAGAGVARGEFLAFLNNDTVVESGWLDALLSAFEQEPEAGLVGAKLVYPDGRLQEAGGIVFADGSGWNYGRFDDPADPRYEFRREADYCSGAAILLRRDLFGQLGGFDLRYAPAYYEDTDLAFAVRAAGKKVIYEPRATVVHFEGITAGTDTGSGMKRHQLINRATFQEKWQRELAHQPAPIHDAKDAEAAANFRARGHVLIVDAYTPTPDQDSGSLRMLNIMRLLREAGHAVSFLPDNRAHAGAYTQALQALGVQALYHPFVSDPVAWLRAHGKSLGTVVLSRHYVAANHVGLVRLYAPQARLIFDTVDVHHLREQRAAALSGSAEQAAQAARTRAQELKLMRECDVTLVVSAAEKALLARDLPGVRIEVLSNIHAIPGRRREFDARRDLVFVGGFQHPPNVDAVLWFVREVFAHVRKALPDVVFHVIGSKAPKSILELAHDGVQVHGFVADIAPFMDSCRLALAPLRYGAGVKGKINMAMSHGLPVVATTPAAEGMHARNGVDLLVADSPEGFAAAIVRAYADAALWTKLSDNGLANVREHFSFDAARVALAGILPPR